MLSTTRLFITTHVLDDGNRPVNKLLEMFSTCRGQAGVEDGSSGMSPLRRLKLTSRTMMLRDDTNSSGRRPDSELWDRLRRNRPVRLPRDDEMCPSRPFAASKTSVTAPSVPPQIIPSHAQQSVPFRFHDAARPPSRDSPARNWMRELSSCSVQELVEEAKESSSSSSTRAGPSKGKSMRRKEEEDLTLHCVISCSRSRHKGKESRVKDWTLRHTSTPHWCLARLPQQLPGSRHHVSVEAACDNLLKKLNPLAQPPLIL